MFTKKLFYIYIYLLFIHNLTAELLVDEFIVIDTDTALIWQNDAVNSVEDDNTWENIINSTIIDNSNKTCEKLNLAGRTNWRLPNINELKTLLDYSQYNPSMNSIFNKPIQEDKHIDYISSTTNTIDESSGWYVNFYSGLVSIQKKDGSSFNSKLHYRCVTNR